MPKVTGSAPVSYTHLDVYKRQEDTYVVSLSSRTIVYKGMFLVGELRLFFSDLQDEDYKSAIAIVPVSYTHLAASVLWPPSALQERTAGGRRFRTNLRPRRGRSRSGPFLS